jgi:hypothetical protein
MVDLPAQRRREGGRATRQARLAAVRALEIRRTLLAYLDVRATVLRPKTIEKLTSALAIFGEYLGEHHPHVRSIRQLQRRHVEGFLAWTATRSCRGTHDASRRVGAHVHAHAAIALRGFLDDITAWGWADAPSQRLVFATDIPRQPQPLPRALPPDVDAALMTAADQLEDRFARVGITVLRRTGLRIGELLDHANIFENCPNFVTTPAFATVLETQLADVRLLRQDAADRGGHLRSPGTSAWSTASSGTSAGFPTTRLGKLLLDTTRGPVNWRSTCRPPRLSGRRRRGRRRGGPGRGR